MTGTAAVAARRRSMAGFALVLVLLSLAAYWPVQRNGFLFHDDQDYITRNTVVKLGPMSRQMLVTLPLVLLLLDFQQCEWQTRLSLSPVTSARPSGPRGLFGDSPVR